jgi:hypothetical protein
VILALNSFKQLDFVKEINCILCVVGTNVLNIINLEFSHTGRTKLRHLSTNLSWHRPELKPGPIHVTFLVKEWHWNRFSSGYYEFPHQYHSANAPYSYLS